MDLSLRTESYAVDDTSWLASRHGVGETQSITLDTSAFTANTHYPNGFFMSGIPLAKITASGLYGPYDNAAADGREVLAGLLMFSVPVPKSGGDTPAAIFEHGKVRTSRLPIAVDAAGKADVARSIIFN